MRSIRLFLYGIIGVGSTIVDVPLNVFIGGPISADVVAFVRIKGILYEVVLKGGIFVTPMETYLLVFCWIICEKSSLRVLFRYLGRSLFPSSNKGLMLIFSKVP